MIHDVVATDYGVLTFPQLVDRRSRWLGSHVEQYAD